MADRLRQRVSLPMVLVGVGLIALAARLVFFLQLGDTPFGRVAFLDARLYEAWAERIAAGDWLGGDEPFFVEPGYVYLLAGSKALGGSLGAMRFVQALVGSGTAVLTALLTVRLSNSLLGAAAAGVVVALYAPLVHFEGQLLKTTFEVFAATLTLVIALAPRPRPFLVGLSAGAALMLKSNFSVVLAPLLLFAAWRARDTKRGATVAILWMLLGLAPLLAATGVRNAVVSGEALVLPWSSGINFYIGNGPEADGLDPTLPFAEAGPTGEGMAGRREAERRAGRVLGFGESSSFWWAETGRAIADDPARFARLLVDKTRLLLHHYEFTDNVSFYFVRERTPVLRWLPAGSWIAVPLALMGLVGTWFRREPGRLLVAATLILQAAGIVAFHVLDRYRLALVPAAIALGVTACVDRSRGSGAPAAWLVATASVGLALCLVVPPPIGVKGQGFAGQHRMLAMEAAQRGAYAEAVAEFERAVALKPDVQDYHFRLAVARRLAGDTAGAERAETRGMQLDPEHGPLRLGLLLAPHDPERAASFCQRAADSGDRVGAALYCAGRALRAAGRPADAIVALTRATAYAPQFFEAWVELGDARLEQSDVDGARAAWAEALLLRPEDEDSRRKLEELPPSPDRLDPVPGPGAARRP